MSSLIRRVGLVAGAVLLIRALIPSDCTGQVVVTIGENDIASSYETNSQALPPDSNGTIGPSNFVEFVNGDFAVFDRNDLTSSIHESDLIFWANTGIALASSQAVSDPRVIYDPFTQRWFASMVDFDANASDPTTEANDFLLAVSTTSDPNGTWHGYKIRADPQHGDFADFPTLGVDSNAVYISGNMFKGSNNNIGPNLLSLPKADLLNSNISTGTYFGVLNPTNYGWVLQAATGFGASTNGYILSMGDLGSDTSPHSNIFSFRVLGSGHANAKLSTPTNIIVNSYTTPFNADNGAPIFTVTQPDLSQTLLGNDPRFSARVYNVGGVLYGVHNTEFNNRMAIQWYRINATNAALLEQGLISDTNLDLFYPCIAANSSGMVVIGCNGTSVNTYISSYVYVGQTVNGVTSFGSSILLQSGVVSYHDANEITSQLLMGPVVDSRWGDYNTISVDPYDPTQFWSIIMIPTDANNATGIGEGIWSTWITQLIVTSPSTSLTAAPSGTNVLLSWPTSGASFLLQSSTNLALSNSWVTITPSLSTNGSTISTLIPKSNTWRFFRLKQ